MIPASCTREPVMSEAGVNEHPKSTVNDGRVSTQISATAPAACTLVWAAPLLLHPQTSAVQCPSCSPSKMKTYDGGYQLKASKQGPKRRIYRTS